MACSDGKGGPRGISFTTRWRNSLAIIPSRSAGRVTDIVPAGEAFNFVCADGTPGSASKVLLATGLVDDLPELTGLEPPYGVLCITVFTATVLNMLGSRWLPMARVIRVRSWLS